MKKLYSLLFSTSTMGFLFLLTAVTMAFATFVESSYGTESARVMVYGARWFEVIFLFLCFNMIANFFRFKLYRKGKWTLGIFHLAFIIIIVGAGITRYVGQEGLMRIREGETVNEMATLVSYITARVDQGQETDEVTSKVIMSALSTDAFSESLQVGGSEFSIESVKYLPNAVEQVVENPSGQPIIDLVYANGPSLKSLVLQAGQMKEIGNLTVGFGHDADLRFVKNENHLLLMASSEVKVMGMGESLQKLFQPGETIPVQVRQLYQVAGRAFVVRNFMPSASLQAIANRDTNRPGREAVVVNVDNGTQLQQATVWLTDEALKSETTLKFGDATVSLSGGKKRITLPFSIHLDDFVLERYPGSNSPSSYESKVTLLDSEMGIEKEFNIYMNHVLDHRGFRFYQSSYDRDELGTVLSVNNDFLGTRVTYIGYFLLFLGMVLAIFNRQSYFARMMKKAAGNTVAKMGLFGVVLFGANTVFAQSQVDKALADAFSEVWVQGHDGRVEPFTTLAYEIVSKVARAGSVSGQTPEQVVLGMVQFPDQWQQTPMISVSNKELASMLGIVGNKASYRNFFDGKGNYKLGGLVQLAFAKDPSHRSKLESYAIKVDERLNVCLMVYRGELFKFFPSPDLDDDHWYSPVGVLPNMSSADSAFIRHSFVEFLDAAAGGKRNETQYKLNAIKEYQQQYGQDLIPGRLKGKLEIAYHKINIFQKLFGVYLLLGFGLLVLFLRLLLNEKQHGDGIRRGLVSFLWLAFILHSVGLIVRGYISGHMPWSNGYESMIYVAWAGMLAGLLLAKRNPMVLSAASILSGLTLFVAQMSWMNPEITNLVPVLKSYWLTFHVAIITASYGFIGVCAFIGLFNVGLYALKRENNADKIQLNIVQLTNISEAAMILGLYFLTIGTFLGGVWANESWGRYWGWDPKETWSLITIFVYAFITHMRLIPGFKGHFAFNVASVIGLMSVLMTYFGVNYYLTGLHSYGSGEQAPISVLFFVIVGILIIFMILSYRNELKFRSAVSPKTVEKKGD